MTAPAALAALSFVRFVALPDTPPAVTQYNGLLLGLRGSDLSEMGSGPDNPGMLAGIFGYSRPNQGAATQNGLTVDVEWIMAPPIPSTVVAQFNLIPGPQGWLVPASRNTFAATGQELILTHGLPANVVLGMLQALHPASIAEGVERFNRGLPLT